MQQQTILNTAKSRWEGKGKWIYFRGRNGRIGRGNETGKREAEGEEESRGKIRGRGKV